MSERDLDDLLLRLRDTANPIDAVSAAEARVLDRLDRTMESRPRALRAAFRSARRTALALVALGGVATGAAATAAIAVALPASDPAPAPEPTTLTAEPANPTRLPFAAVERSAQRPGGSDRRVFAALAGQHPGMRPDDARGIVAADGTRAWVLPGRSHTCFGAANRDGTGFTCATNARAAAGALSVAEVARDGTVRAVYLVPDDVVAARAGGREFRPESNLVVVTHDEGAPVTFVTEDGSRATRSN
ncbi:MAG: hypothetical protein ITG02_12610 [Patulibacter sp.]|nr:hypothetical protein [Patulibacter sp.]